jgi:gliding motility-associated-like protein
VGFDSQYFLRYGINASPDPTTTPFALSAQVFNYSQLIGYDPSPLVPPNVNTYYYAIDLGLNNGTPNTPLSNDLNTIFLQNVPVSAPEDTTATITWNAYRGWVAPNYRIQYSKDQQPTQWIELGNTNNTTYTFRKPNEEGRYIVRVYTTNAPAALKSYSNWVPFQFERKDLVIPDIFTPNGDATNENFVVQQIEYYPNTNLKVHDRWGKIIYESTNYKNDWDGSNNASGIYYYTLKTADGQEFNGPLKIVR